MTAYSIQWLWFILVTTKREFVKVVMMKRRRVVLMIDDYGCVGKYDFYEVDMNMWSIHLNSWSPDLANYFGFWVQSFAPIRFTQCMESALPFFSWFCSIVAENTNINCIFSTRIYAFLSQNSFAYFFPKWQMANGRKAHSTIIFAFLMCDVKDKNGDKRRKLSSQIECKFVILTMKLLIVEWKWGFWNFG